MTETIAPPEPVNSGRGSVDRILKRSAFVAIGVVAAIPRLLTAGHFETLDEVSWLLRSTKFSDALVHGHLSHMKIDAVFTTTMPGIPTMWLGTIANGVFNVGKLLHLVPQDQVFRLSTQGLAISQSVAALATAALVMSSSWLVARWASTRVGIAFGLLLATEPFWVAHGAVLHTDELTTLFGMTGLLCLAIALDVPRSATVDEVESTDSPALWWLIGAGVLLSCAVLTKLSGLTMVAGAGSIVAWTLVARYRRRPEGQGAWAVCRPVLVGCALVVAASVVTVVVLYPGLWMNPAQEWSRLVASARLGGDARRSFFRGEAVNALPFYFYGYALPWRLTPWALALVVVGLPAALIRRASRSRAVLACVLAVPSVVVLSLAAAKFDRYGLMILAPVFLAACLVLQPGVRPGWRGLHWPARFEKQAWAALGLAGLLYSVSVAPRGMVYFNTALGGGEQAQLAVPVGWYGETGAAMRAIARDAESRGESCDQVTSKGYLDFMISWSHCGHHLDDDEAEYLVVGITRRQRLSDFGYWALTHDRKLVAVVKVRGIRYVELWRREPLDGGS